VDRGEHSDGKSGAQVLQPLFLGVGKGSGGRFSSYAQVLQHLEGSGVWVAPVSVGLRDMEGQESFGGTMAGMAAGEAVAGVALPPFPDALDVLMASIVVVVTSAPARLGLGASELLAGGIGTVFLMVGGLWVWQEPAVAVWAFALVCLHGRPLSGRKCRDQAQKGRSLC
jgi:hypothetical protein